MESFQDFIRMYCLVGTDENGNKYQGKSSDLYAAFKDYASEEHQSDKPDFCKGSGTFMRK